MDSIKNINEYPDIPAEKFAFKHDESLGHDKALATKPVSYFKGAFKRFCKNKGSVVAAIIIACLILFAIIVPFCTPYSTSYSDPSFTTVAPKSKLFANTSFWDGCTTKEVGKIKFAEDLALSKETGYNIIKNLDYEINKDGNYKYRYDNYYGVGDGRYVFGKYKIISYEDYENIQKYQDETGRQVIFPTVRLKDRPEQDPTNARYYYKTRMVRGRTEAVTDDKGNVTPVYWTCTDDEYFDEDGKPIDMYTSKMRLEGVDGFVNEDGEHCYYSYARKVSGGNVEVRMYYYEYYIYNHTQVLKDGITEPYFVFGTETNGKDILTCLASGARFSFLFAIAVAVVNMVVGAIYGAIEGYYGGKTDLVMERISDILAAVPFMIVITLLKLHMGSTSHMLILFISFFLTGWIGMASTTRMQFYRFKNQEYVLAARTLGASDRRLMFKHIFPNAIGTLVTACALVIPGMIYSETSLTYLGIINLEVGNITSVGTLIANGQACMATTPHAVLFPSLFLVLLMLSFNLFGNGLRDAFNPQLRGSEG